MTLDEAIIHAEEQAELLEESARGCDLDDRVEKEIACKSGKCAAEHRQLAEWLKELREYKQQNAPDIHVGKTDLLEKLRRFDPDYMGKWIFHADWKHKGYAPYECNRCGRAFEYEMNYCGYCGAYMKRRAK